jgi:hypothetical protein
LIGFSNGVLSIESLPLALILGINGALFLEPLAKYGEPQLKQEIFSRFLQHNTLGGLMITEPGYGTDALSMQTQWTFEMGLNGYDSSLINQAMDSMGQRIHGLMGTFLKDDSSCLIENLKGRHSLWLDTL